MGVLQKISKETKEFDRAYYYYSVLFAINGLNVTKKELQLVAFTAIRGHISFDVAKQKFCSEFDTTVQTVNNMISKLKKKKIMVKQDGWTKVNPIIALDFKKDIVLQISFIDESKSKK